MLTLSKENIIKAFDSTSTYLDELLNTDNTNKITQEISILINNFIMFILNKWFVIYTQLNLDQIKQIVLYRRPFTPPPRPRRSKKTAKIQHQLLNSEIVIYKINT